MIPWLLHCKVREEPTHQKGNFTVEGYSNDIVVSIDSTLHKSSATAALCKHLFQTWCSKPENVTIQTVFTDTRAHVHAYTYTGMFNPLK